MPSRSRLRILSLMAASIVVLFGSATWFALHLKKPGYVNRTPQEGLHPRTEAPYAQKYWMGLYGDPASEFGFPFSEVEFKAIDGSTLRGWLVPSPGNSESAVVTVHGGEGDRRTFMRQLPMLHEAGYPVLLFDYREHGISDGASRGIAFGWRENHDVSSAVSFLKNSMSYERVAAFGTSMGASSAIIAAGRDPSIDVVIAENPFASANDVLGEARFFGSLPRFYREIVLEIMKVRFGLWGEPDSIDVVASIAPRPLLLMHGTADRSVGVWQTQLLFDRAKDPKELWILEGAEHTALFNKDPLEYRRRVIGFLDQHLRRSTPGPEESP